VTSRASTTILLLPVMNDAGEGVADRLAGRRAADENEPEIHTWP
jgi:hypothetical protein